MNAKFRKPLCKYTVRCWECEKRYTLRAGNINVLTENMRAAGWVISFINGDPKLGTMSVCPKCSAEQSRDAIHFALTDGRDIAVYTLEQFQKKWKQLRTQDGEIVMSTKDGNCKIGETSEQGQWWIDLDEVTLALAPKSAPKIE